MVMSIYSHHHHHHSRTEIPEPNMQSLKSKKKKWNSEIRMDDLPKIKVR